MIWDIRISRLALAGTAAAAALAGCQLDPMGADTAIDNVSVVNVRTGEIRRDQMILIEDGRIVAVEPSRPALGRALLNADIAWIDGEGAYAVPGLWDAHLHIAQEDTRTAVDYIAPMALSYGITHARDMGSSLEARAAMLSALEQRPAAGPQIIAPGPTFWAIELPWGDKSRQMIAETPEEIRAAVAAVAAQGVDFIKLYSGFDEDTLPVLAEAAAANGLRLGGHAQRGVDLAAHAEAGVDTIEHSDFQTFQGCGQDSGLYFNRIIAARFRDSGESILDIIAEFEAGVDEAECAHTLQRAADAGLALTPTMAISYLTPDFIDQIDPADLTSPFLNSCEVYRSQFDGATDDQVAAFSQAGSNLVRRAVNAGIPMLVGTDASAFCAVPGQSLAWEMELMSGAGLSPLQVLQGATLLPAEIFGLSEDLGAIEPGKSADIVLLADNPLADIRAVGDVQGVYTQQVWLDRDALASMRAEARAALPARAQTRP